MTMFPETLNRKITDLVCQPHYPASSCSFVFLYSITAQKVMGVRGEHGGGD